MAAGDTAQPIALEIPQPHSILDLTMADGAVIHVRRHGNSSGPRIVFAHGNGFASDAYFPFWRQLLPDFDLIVYDQRNHGWNPRHDFAHHTVVQMAEDMEVVRLAVEQAFGRRRTAGVFHSVSSIVSLVHFMKHGMSWDGLVLLDPPIVPPPGHRLHEKAHGFEITLHQWALQRRNSFADPSELASHFKSARRLRRWIDGAADLMARAITQQAPAAGYELACPPRFEAEIYLQNARSPCWSAFPACASDILLICSDYNAPDADPPGLVCQALAEEFGVEVVPIPETGHLLPIERPAEIEAVLREHLRSRRF